MDGRPNRAKEAEYKDSWLKCPVCKRPIARAYFGALAQGIEIKCRCGEFVVINLQVK